MGRRARGALALLAALPLLWARPSGGTPGAPVDVPPPPAPPPLPGSSAPIGSEAPAPVDPPPQASRARRVLEVATDPDHPSPQEGEPAPTRLTPLHALTNTGLGPRISAGVALTSRVASGAYGRVELETYRVGVRGEPDTMIDVLPLGIEGWGARSAWGVGLPTTLAIGSYRRPGFASFGLGWSWFLLDRIEGQTGFSAFAPHAEVRLGADVGGVRLSLDWRAIYRWHARAEDRGQLQFGLSLGFLDR